jgi:hypothetical protein
MRILLIDPKAKEDIAAVCKYAEENPVSNKEILARVADPDDYLVFGDDENHVCHLSDGFKCVFSIEEQDFGWTRHLSVSVRGKDEETLPNIEAVRLIMIEFGIDKPLEECFTYIENSTPKSVNIICPIKQ